MSDTMYMAEVQEKEIAAAARVDRNADPISAAVGSAVFSRHHRFDGLLPSARSIYGRPEVSRFYFEVGVVVDVVPRQDLQRRMIAVKRAYCDACGLLYICVGAEHDEVGVKEQLAAAAKVAAKPAHPPVVSQRPPKVATPRQTPGVISRPRRQQSRRTP